MAVTGAKSVYFSDKVKSEQNLYEDIIIESISIYGQSIYYMPRTLVDRDWILNEDKESKFESALEMPMYIENVEGFGGEGDLFQKFGLEIRDEITFVAARRTWERYVGEQEGLIRPNEGDLIYLPLSNALFEISHVEKEEPFYQISNLPVYRLNCRLFEYSGEDFDTGIGAVDDFETVSTYQYILTVDVEGFKIGSTVTQNQVSGKVLGYNDHDPRQIIVGDLTSASGEFAQFEVNDTYPISDGILAGSITAVTGVDDFNNEPYAKNTEFETVGDNFIDFSESNPFGE